MLSMELYIHVFMFETGNSDYSVYIGFDKNLSTSK